MNHSVEELIDFCSKEIDSLKALEDVFAFNEQDVFFKEQIAKFESLRGILEKQFDT